MSFTIAASQALGESSATFADQHQQASNLTGVLETGLSLQSTGQHPGLKRTPTNGVDLNKSLDDVDAIQRGVQQMIAETLGESGADLAALHAAVTLNLAQPDAAPEVLTPAAPGQPKKKPARDTVAQTQLAWATSVALQQMATGGGLERANEADMKAAKLFYRQAGSLIMDTASVLLQTAILHTIRAMKLFIKVADFDLSADALTQHVNYWFSACKQAVHYVKGTFTLSIGGKTKLVLKQQAEIVALQRIVVQLSEDIAILSAAVTNLRVPLGLTLETTAFKVQTPGILFEITPTGISASLSPSVPTLIPPLLPSPLPDAIPDVTVGEALRSPKTTAVNIGQVSGPAHLPSATGAGVLQK